MNRRNGLPRNRSLYESLISFSVMKGYLLSYFRIHENYIRMPGNSFTYLKTLSVDPAGM